MEYQRAIKCQGTYEEEPQEKLIARDINVYYRVILIKTICCYVAINKVEYAPRFQKHNAWCVYACMCDIIWYI